MGAMGRVRGAAGKGWEVEGGGRCHCRWQRASDVRAMMRACVGRNGKRGRCGVAVAPLLPVRAPLHLEELFRTDPEQLRRRVTCRGLRLPHQLRAVAVGVLAEAHGAEMQQPAHLLGRGWRVAWGRGRGSGMHPCHERGDGGKLGGGKVQGGGNVE